MDNLQTFHVVMRGTSPPFFTIAGGPAVSVVASTDDPLIKQYIIGSFVHSFRVEGSFSHDTFSIDDLPSDTYYLAESIEAKISYIDGEYLAEFAEAEIVTSGETAEEAIQWLKESIVNLYEFYNDNRGALGPLPRRQLNILETYIA